jgi:hypothetical protein
MATWTVEDYLKIAYGNGPVERSSKVFVHTPEQIHHVRREDVKEALKESIRLSLSNLEK